MAEKEPYVYCNNTDEIVLVRLRVWDVDIYLRCGEMKSIHCGNGESRTIYDEIIASCNKEKSND